MLRKASMRRAFDCWEPCSTTARFQSRRSSTEDCECSQVATTESLARGAKIRLACNKSLDQPEQIRPGKNKVPMNQKWTCGQMTWPEHERERLRCESH